MINFLATSRLFHPLWRIGFIEKAFFKLCRKLERAQLTAFMLWNFGFDISKWQGAVDFVKMSTYGARFLILRCVYGLTQDERFAEYMTYAPAKFTALSAYVYYDPRFDPIQQANKVIAVLAAHKSKIKRVWLDLEFSWAGSYEAPQHWKTFRDIIKAAGYKVGWYTRKTWWDSRVGTYAAEFAKDPCWAAQYNTSLTLIPAGWTTAMIWQQGTPAIGAEAGVSSAEIDFDIWNDEFDFAAEWGTSPVTPPPPPDGGNTMKATMQNYTVNVRDAGFNIVSQLVSGDVVYGEVYTDNRERIRFSKIYRKAGNIENMGGVCNAVTNDAKTPPLYYMTLTNEQEPGTNPPPPPPPQGVTYTVKVTIDETAKVVTGVNVDGTDWVKG